MSDDSTCKALSDSLFFEAAPSNNYYVVGMDERKSLFTLL